MTDLVIGARRPTAARPLRALLVTLLLLGVAGLVAFILFRRVVSYPVPDGDVPKERPELVTGDLQGRLVYAGCSLSHSGRIAVLRLVGEPHTLGVARGRLQLDALGPPTAALAPILDATAPDGGFLSSLTHSLRVRWRYRLLDDGIPGHQLRELAGLARGGQKIPDYEDLVRQQAALDVGRPAPASPGHRTRAVARSLSFVAPMRGAAGDRLLVGRSFGLPGAADGGLAAARPVVSFVHPDDVIPFAAVGWPGLIGVVSGVNAEGIAVMVHPAAADDVRVTRQAQPVALIARDVLENARTLDDAIGILENAKPLGAAAFLVASGKERSYAVVERSPGRKAVTRKPEDPALTDLLAGKAFQDDAENDRARRTRPSAMRKARVRELLRGGPLETPAQAATILRDRRGPKGRGLPLGHRGAAEDLAAEAAIFDLSAMVLWVSEGPGASGRFRAFDLRYELGGEGRRPAPPPDIPETGDLDPADARAILAARADLVRARRAWLGHSRGRAREWIDRALERAPDLPEALLLAGDYARAAGDKEAARGYYRRYLDGGPDDLSAAEQVRAHLQNMR